MYKVEFTKEELDALIIQIDARINALKEIQKVEARKENIRRVIELEEFMKEIITGKEKMMDVRYK